MKLEKSEVMAAIRSKVQELAANLGADAAPLGDQDIIPATGLLDSAAILELVVWFESAFDLALEQEDINIDNLGSIDAMANFLLSRRG